jgi:hypothetical protein
MGARRSVDGGSASVRTVKKPPSSASHGPFWRKVVNWTRSPPYIQRRTMWALVTIDGVTLAPESPAVLAASNMGAAPMPD